MASCNLLKNNKGYDVVGIASLHEVNGKSALPLT